MKFSEARIIEFHRTLHECCGMPALRMTFNDQRLWHDFLIEMAPLEDHPDGPLSIEDIKAVIREQKWQCRQGKASWSLRPGATLQNAIAFRDLLLQVRAQRKPLRRPESPVEANSQHSESQPDASEQPKESPISGEEFSESIRRMKAKLRGGAE